MSPYLPSSADLRFFWAVIIKEAGESCDYNFRTLVAQIDTNPTAYIQTMIGMGMIHYWLQRLYEKDPEAYVQLVQSMSHNTSPSMDNFFKTFIDQEMFILRSFAVANSTQIEDYLTQFFNKWFPGESVDFSTLSADAKHTVDLLEQNLAYRQSIMTVNVNEVLPSDSARAIKYTGTVAEHVDFLIQTSGMGENLKYLDQTAADARKEYLTEVLTDEQDQNRPTVLQEYELNKLMYFDDLIQKYKKSLKLFETINEFTSVEYDEDALFIVLRKNNVSEFFNRKEAEYWLKSAENRQEIPGKINFLKEVIQQLEWFSEQFTDVHKLLSAKIYIPTKLVTGDPEIDKIPDDAWENIWDIPASVTPEPMGTLLEEKSLSLIIKQESVPKKESGYSSLASWKFLSDAENRASQKTTYADFLNSLMPFKDNKIVDKNENSPLLEKCAPKNTHTQALGKGLPTQTPKKRAPLQPVQENFSARGQGLAVQKLKIGLPAPPVAAISVTIK